MGWENMSAAERAAWTYANPPGVAPPEQATGVANVTGTVPGVYPVLQWQSARLVPFVVHVGEGVGLPPFTSQSTFAEVVGGLRLTLRVTYGSGGAVRTAEMDLRTGAFQLPPCSYVQISVINSRLGGTFNIAVAISEGADDSLDVPTFTTQVLAGNVPAMARAVELVSPGKLFVTGDSVQQIESDWTVLPTVMAPPFSPVRVTGYTYTFVPAATYVGSTTLRWLLSL